MKIFHEDFLSRWKRKKRKPETMSWFWNWGALSLALGGSAVGTFLSATAQKKDPIDSVMFLCGAILAFCGIVLNIVNQVKNKRHSAEINKSRHQTLENFSDELSPVISSFIELLEAEKGKESSDKFFNSVLRETRGLFTYRGVRLCVYDLEEREIDHDDKNSSTDTRFLERKAYAGRHDPPRRSFTPDTEHGKFVIETACGFTAIPIDDPSATKHPIDRNANTIWQSSMLVPIHIDQFPRGILMVDTREKVTFTSVDKSIGWTIASMLAIGMRKVARSGDVTDAEVNRTKELLRDIEADAAQGES